MPDMLKNKKIRLVDIAEMTGTSSVTVSKVLNRSAGNHTRVSPRTAERILDVAQRLGYRPNLSAQRLAGGKSQLIGVLLDANTNEITRVFHAEKAANLRNYRFLIGQCHPDMRNIQNYLDDFADYGVCGLVVHANSYPDMNREIVEAARKFENVVFYDRPIHDDGTVDFVDVDLSMGTRNLVEHLVALGRRRIAYFAPYAFPRHGKYRSWSERERGYREGMEQNGLPFDPGFAERHVAESMPDDEGMVGLVRELLARERPDAIMTRNDEVATSVLRALKRLGARCPDDVAVAGYDNLPLSAHLYPSLTTVDNRLEELSALAVNTLLNRVEGQAKPDERTRVTLDPKLVIRESTAGFGQVPRHD